MNKKLLSALLVCVLIVVAAVSSCPSEDLQTTLYANFEEAKETPSEAEFNSEVFFDASGSMKAYYVADDGRFAGQISKLYGCSQKISMFFLSKDKEVNFTPYEGRIADIVNNLKAFNGGDTRFDVLLPMLCKRATKGKVCFLVTDGIIFVNKNTSKGLVEYQNILARELKNVGAGSKGFAIFKYSANFDGRDIKKGVCYFTMNDKRETLLEKDRPYYIVAIGDKADILRLRDVAASSLSPELALYYGVHDIAVHCSGKQNSDAENKVNAESELTLTATLPECLSRWHAMYPAYMANNAKVTLNTSTSGVEKELKAKNDYSVEMVNGANVSLNVRLTPNPAREEGVVTVTVANAIPQEWIDLSVDDDTDVNKVRKKTFGLKYLVGGVMQATGEDKKPLAEIKYEYKY